MSSALFGWMMGLSPWLQVPAILAVAAPVCAAVGYALLRLVDGVGRAAARLFSRR
ncbi:hypothetical protein [Corynebacterium sp. HMSC05H05]|uniref:hypothetical protein n=1 Tax=Corynebacterium sp. HMSC05H05 TaxID=1581119 RepID=UPI0014389D08|nr:hypothetical protein [Corynebacterium sp. HMSC05H05]